MSQNQSLTKEVGPMSITPQELAEAHEALDKLLDSGIGGSTHDPNVAAAFLEYAAKKQILLSPIMGAFRLRPGWELAFTKLKVDTSKEARLVYKVSDEQSNDSQEWGPNTLLAFHKPMLNIIRTHLGIDMKDIVRIDDRTRDYCYEFKVFGEYLAVDGQIKTLVDQGGLDLSDGSAAVNKIYNEARGNGIEEKRRNAEKQIDRKRAKVLQFATTNAEERLIISYGFRGSYTKGELDKKFIVCVRPLFTGYHPDPEMQKVLLGHMLEEGKQKSSSSRLLYGASTAAPAEVAQPGQPGRGLTQEEMAELKRQESLADDETAETESGNPKQCKPGKCLGMDPGAVHVPQCFQADVEPEPEPWVVPAGRGPAQGMKINDPSITSDLLGSMRTFYTQAIEDEKTAPLEKQALIEEQRFLEAEIKRRGLFEHAAKT